MPGWRERIARPLWYAHPARPGPELALLEASQWWPREKVEELQLRRLRELVAAARRIPFYRERFATAGVAPEDLRSLEDVRRLPILEREEVERLGLAGLRAPGSWGMKARSSGSLGRPVHFLWPLSEMRWRDACEARAHAWLGAAIGERRLEVRCRPVGPAQRLSALLLNADALHAPTIVDRRVVARLIRSAERHPPALVWGVSNALYVVALALIEEGRRVPARACWSGGNHLHEHYRKALGEAFACPVYERYATMETGLVAHECVEGGSLHVPAEGILAEIVRADGSPAAPGETGDVLLTALHNPATPFLRYRVGDRAIAPESTVCSCGRGLPVFGTVAGRARDVLRTAAGASVGPRQAVEAMRPVMASVVDFQAIQEADRSLQILLVQRDLPRAAADRETVATIFDRLVAPPRPTRVERVDSIALTPGGKLRTIVAR